MLCYYWRAIKVFLKSITCECFPSRVRDLRRGGWLGSSVRRHALSSTDLGVCRLEPSLTGQQAIPSPFTSPTALGWRCSRRVPHVWLRTFQSDPVKMEVVLASSPRSPTTTVMDSPNSIFLVVVSTELPHQKIRRQNNVSSSLIFIAISWSRYSLSLFCRPGNWGTHHLVQWLLSLHCLHESPHHMLSLSSHGTLLEQLLRT